MDINTGFHPNITLKPYTLPLKYTQWVHEKLEMLEKSGIISWSIFPWLSTIVIVSKKAQPGEISQKSMKSIVL